jgi:predicted nucleotidyltransferase
MWALLLQRMRAEFETWSTPPVAAWLFGSAARGEARVDSDIDVLLVPPAAARHSDEDQATWEQQTDVFVAKVPAWSGNACELLVMDFAELEAAAARDERLIRDLRAEAVVLPGNHPRSVLPRRARS